MTFAIGFACGVAVVVFCCWMLARREDRKDREIRHRVDMLWRKLACGNGIVGCDGGPNCKWDHK